MRDSDVIDQLQVLVADLSHAVSYKWLSRRFSVSSNAAKRLLQEFADKHGGALEIVYAISGWTQADPASFSVQLVHKKRLEEVKCLIRGEPSIHVYSVQASLPKDPAQLWSSDFIQAEELFNEPPEVNNCLRDNRFSGVSCSIVTRNLNGRPVPAAVSASKAVQPAFSLKIEQLKPKPAKIDQPSSSKPAKLHRSSSDDKGEQPSSSRPSHMEQPLSFKTARLKPENMEIEPVEVNGRSAQADSAAKDRKLLKTTIDERGRESKVTEDLEAKEDTSKQPAPGLKPINSSAQADGVAKKRKVLRTRIDERGREVTEVVWDFEGMEETKKQADPAPKPQPQPEAPKKQQETVSAKPPQKPAPKSNKSAATRSSKGVKGAQQGSITSFFKKQ